MLPAEVQKLVKNEYARTSIRVKAKQLSRRKDFDSLCREDIDQFEQQEALDSALANMPPEMRDMSEQLMEVSRLLTAHRVTGDRRQCRWLVLASFATKVEYEVAVIGVAILCPQDLVRFGVSRGG